MSRRRFLPISVALLIISSLFLSSCKYYDYEIVLPIKGAKFVDQLPDRFLIRYEAIPLEITLNGIPVQHLFSFEEGEATASGDILAGYLRQGRNNFGVDTREFGPRRFFDYDTEGPRVLIYSVETDGAVTIRGELKDPAGGYGATINGIPLELDRRDRFEVTVSPASIYTFQTEDNYAQLATHHFANRATIVDDIIKLKVDEETIDQLIPSIQELAEEKNLAALLGSADANVIIDTHIGITIPSYSITEEVEVCNFFLLKLICDIVDEITEFTSQTFNLLDLEAVLTTLSFEELEIDELDLHSGSGWEGLTLDATLKEIDLGVEFDIDVLGLSSLAKAALRFFGWEDELDALDGEFTVNIHVNRIRLNADLGLSATNGDVDISVEGIHAVGLNDLDSDFQFNINLPSAISDFGFGLGGLVIDAIEAGISAARDLIVDLLLEKLVPLIANAVLDPLINELQIRSGATINNGAFLTVLVGVEELHVLNDNELIVTLNGRIGTETTDSDIGDIELGINLGFPELLGIDDDIFPNLLGIPENLGPAPGIVHDTLGFKYTPTAVPAPDGENNLSMVVSANVLNQAFLAIYEAGLLSPNINILNELKDNGQYILTDPETANRRILFSPTMAPEISFRGHIQSVAYINVDNFDILFQKLNDVDEWENLLDLSITAEIPVQISVDGRGGLQLALINPAVELEFVFKHWAQFTLRLPTGLFATRRVASLILDQLNYGLGLIRYPQSLFLEQEETTLSIRPETFKTVGKPRDHFSLSASFEDL